MKIINKLLGSNSMFANQLPSIVPMYSLLYILVAPCLAWALNTPENGGKSCVSNDDGGNTCTLTCDSGFYFHDVPQSDDNTKTHQVVTCSPGESWEAPDCIGMWLSLIFLLIV